MQASIPQIEKQRVALTGHCYRMLGSVVDADDAVQETMVRAWRSLERFDGRSSLNTWLYRIATNVCLDALADRSRRTRPIEDGPLGTIDDALESRPRTHWLEPIPDAHAVPDHADPAEKAVLRQSIRLAFVAALQHLPPKQRAVLLLMEVLGWSAAEVAESLETSVASVNSALQRARATLASRDLGDRDAVTSAEQAALVERYVAAFERYDVEALAKLLHEDATLSMPPFTLWLRGHEPIKSWLLGRGAACRGSRLLPVAAAGSPAFAQYKPAPEGGYVPWALLVIELRKRAHRFHHVLPGHGGAVPAVWPAGIPACRLLNRRRYKRIWSVGGTDDSGPRRESIWVKETDEKRNKPWQPQTPARSS